MKSSEQYIRRVLFDLNRRVNDATTFKEKHFYRAYIYSIIEGLQNTGIDIDIPDSILQKSNLFDNTIDNDFNSQVIYDFRANRDFYREFGKLSEATIGYFEEDPYKYIEKISFDDSIDMARGFLSYYDNNMARHFDRLLDEKLVEVFLPGTEDAETYDGFTYHFPSDTDLIITLDKGNIETAATIIHELVHSFLSLYDINMTYDQDTRKCVNNLNETYSKFIEIVFMKYLSDIGFNKSDIASYMRNFNSMLYESLYVFDDCLDDKEKNLFGNDFGIYWEAQRNAFGGVLAYHYYDKYLDRPYLVKQDLLNLYQESKFKSKSYLLDNCGLRKKDIVKPKVLVMRMNDFEERDVFDNAS